MLKVKEWIMKTGLANFAYLGGALIGKFLLGSQLLFGAGLGIFLYLNFNVIRKIVKENIEK